MRPSILDITESKLGGSVKNAEVNINDYSITKNDRNRKGGSVACSIRNDLCFNIKNILSNFIEHVFFRNSHCQTIPSKLTAKPIKFIYLGNFNINSLHYRKFILEESQSYKLKNCSSVLVNKYKKFCQTFPLTEIIKDPTRIACSTSTLLDHSLTKSSERFSQKGAIDLGISDDQLIFCTRKNQKKN